MYNINLKLVCTRCLNPFKNNNTSKKSKTQQKSSSNFDENGLPHVLVGVGITTAERKINPQNMQQYSSNPSRKSKISSDLAVKNEKSSFLTQKPTKPQF